MKRLMLLLLALLSQSTAPALAQSAAPKSAGEPMRIVLLVDEIRAIRNFPAIVAERLGYLNGEGIVVTMMNIRDEVPTAEMLMDGRIDAIMAYYHHNIVNRAAGRNFEAIVTLGVTPGRQGPGGESGEGSRQDRGRSQGKPHHRRRRRLVQDRRRQRAAARGRSQGRRLHPHPQREQGQDRGRAARRRSRSRRCAHARRRLLRKPRARDGVRRPDHGRRARASISERYSRRRPSTCEASA